ncbi:MAG: 30S ribosomal protein S6 [Algisphaera sp.]
MADLTPKLYEGMFLLTQGAVSAGADQALDIVRGFLSRVDAEIVTLYRWEERKLAYPIASQKRGTFYLTLFNAAPTAISAIERECNLSEDVLRVMMTRADYMGDTEIDDAKKASEGLPEEEAPDTDATPSTDAASPAESTEENAE